MFWLLKSSAVFMVIFVPVFAFVGILRGTPLPDQVVPAPQTAADFMRRGNLYWKRQSYERALAEYTQASTLDPTLENSYIRQGMALKAMGELDAARERYQQARAIAQSQGKLHVVQQMDLFIQRLQEE